MLNTSDLGLQSSGREALFPVECQHYWKKNLTQKSHSSQPFIFIAQRNHCCHILQDCPKYHHMGNETEQTNLCSI